MVIADDFFVFGAIFVECLKNLRVLRRYEETNFGVEFGEVLLYGVGRHCVGALHL